MRVSDLRSNPAGHGGQCGQQGFHDFSLVVHQVESDGQEIVGRVGVRVDLDPPEDGESALGTTGAGLDNVLHEDVLGVKECEWQFDHAVFGVGQSLSVGENELLDGSLLKVGKLLDVRHHGGSTIGDSLEVSVGRDGGTAAGVDEFDSLSFHLSDGSVLGNSDVGSVDHEAVSIVGNVGRHGAKAGVSGKWKAGKSSEREVVSVNLDKVIFETACEFVAAQGRRQEGVAGGESLGRQDIHDGSF